MTRSPDDARSGAEPRVCRYPAYRYSLGDDAIDLAAMAGLVLDPWQQLVLRHALGEREDGKWSAFEVALIVARQNGKGAVLEALELAGLFLFGEQLILHSAHEYRTAMEAFRRVRDLVENCSDLRKRVRKITNTNGEEGIELRGGARLKFIARSKNAGRGFSADRLIWDEAYALVEDQVDAQMPTLSARPNAQIWYTSSPPLDAVSGAQLFRVRRRALSDEPGALAYFDWGADAELDGLSKVNLDDRGLWAATNPAYGIRISEEAIGRERAAMSDVGFARERLSVWPPDIAGGFRVIPEADWRAAADPRPVPPVLPVAFGLEMSWDREWSAIGVAWKRADGLRQVELTRDAHDELDFRRGSGWVVARAKELVDAWSPCAFVVDPGSPAGSLIDQLEAAGVEVCPMTLRDATHAFGGLFDGVSGRDAAARDVRHGNQPELNAAVGGALRRSLGDGFAWDRKLSAGNFTPLGAVTAALWGYTSMSPEWSAYNLLESVR